MKKTKPAHLLLAFLLVTCTTKPVSNEQESHPVDESKEFTPITWIDDRVAEAEKRLGESDAGKLLLSSIQAHGGLRQWFGNGPIAFHFDYQPLDGGRRRDSYQVVDQWSVRAVHEVAANRNLLYGWDGKQAWNYPDTAEVGVNPRFWSTTPFYFIGLPFVLADEGVILERLTPKEYNGVNYDLIKASYESGVGDAPDDYYVIYIHPETKLMGGLRYIVSYPGFFPNGGHNPEKFMEILGHQEVEGVTIPTGYHTFWFKDAEPAEHITKIDVTEVAFKPELQSNFFDAPEGAKIQEGL